MTNKPCRVDKGIFKNTVAHLSRQEINPFLLSPEPFKNHVIEFFCDANLWQTLTPAVGKCDGMTPGKYRPARVFAFETSELYIWTETETGQRGSSWFLAFKAPAQELGFKPHYWRAESGPERSQVASFFESLLLACVKASPAARQRLLHGSLALSAWEQSQEIEAIIPLSSPGSTPTRKNSRPL